VFLIHPAAFKRRPSLLGPFPRSSKFGSIADPVSSMAIEKPLLHSSFYRLVSLLPLIRCFSEKGERSSSLLSCEQREKVFSPSSPPSIWFWRTHEAITPTVRTSLCSAALTAGNLLEAWKMEPPFGIRDLTKQWHRSSKFPLPLGRGELFAPAPEGRSPATRPKAASPSHGPFFPLVYGEMPFFSLPRARGSQSFSLVPLISRTTNFPRLITFFSRP